MELPSYFIPPYPILSSSLQLTPIPSLVLSLSSLYLPWEGSITLCPVLCSVSSWVMKVLYYYMPIVSCPVPVCVMCALHRYAAIVSTYYNLYMNTFSRQSPFHTLFKMILTDDFAPLANTKCINVILINYISLCRSVAGSVSPRVCRSTVGLWLHHLVSPPTLSKESWQTCLLSAITSIPTSNYHGRDRRRGKRRNTKQRQNKGKEKKRSWATWGSVITANETLIIWSVFQKRCHCYH